MNRQVMDDRLEIYRLAFVAKLYELSGHIFEVTLIRESYAVDYQYRCYITKDVFCSTHYYEDWRNPELSVMEIERDTKMIWKNTQANKKYTISLRENGLLKNNPAMDDSEFFGITVLKTEDGV